MSFATRPCTPQRTVDVRPPAADAGTCLPNVDYRTRGLGGGESGRSERNMAEAERAGISSTAISSGASSWEGGTSPMPTKKEAGVASEEELPLRITQSGAGEVA